MSQATITVRVRCFAAVREALGEDLVTVPLAAGATLQDLRAVLAIRAPALAAMPLAYAKNRDYARADTVLADGDEVALIPPISGGSGAADAVRFDLVHGPIDAGLLERECRTDRDGAVVTFAGTTRDHNDGSAVATLRFEAYAEMVHQVMAAILADASARFAITRVRVAHRLGEVPIGEASVVVVVAAPHRGPSFDACRYVMDRLKHEAPIWKQEQLRDGDALRWVGELPKPGG